MWVEEEQAWYDQPALWKASLRRSLERANGQERILESRTVRPNSGADAQAQTNCLVSGSMVSHVAVARALYRLTARHTETPTKLLRFTRIHLMAF